MASKKSSRPVVVTTAHRGVFVGHTADAGDADTITLTDARMVVYWPVAARSVVGIAARGTPSGSRVSPAVRRIVLRAVTAVLDATPEAASTWAEEPWY
jgi:hypothetical protein